MHLWKKLDKNNKSRTLPVNSYFIIHQNRYSASLRISSKTLNVADITKILGMQPTRTHEKGEPFSSRNPSRLRQESLWLLESGLDSSEPLDAHMEKLADFIQEKAVLLKYLIPICYMDIFCGVFSESGQGGFVFNPVILKKLTAIPIEIVFDLYLSSPSEEDESS